MKNGIEQELKLYPNRQYFYFKGRKVHMMMAHSFFSYKPGYDVHHLNQAKTDNRLNNLVYLTHEQHARLHNTGKKLSGETKEKMRKSHKKTVYCLQLNKVFESIKQAAQELALSAGNISKCCQGKCKTTKGLSFEYFD